MYQPDRKRLAAIAVAAGLLLFSPGRALWADPGYYEVYSVERLRRDLGNVQTTDFTTRDRINRVIETINEIEDELAPILQIPQQGDCQYDPQSESYAPRLRYLLLHHGVSGASSGGYGLFVHDLDRTLDGRPAMAEMSTLDDQHDAKLQRDIPWIKTHHFSDIALRAGIALTGDAALYMRQLLTFEDLAALSTELGIESLDDLALGFLRQATGQTILIIAGKGDGSLGVGRIEASRAGVWYRLDGNQADDSWERFSNRLATLMSQKTFEIRSKISVDAILASLPRDRWGSSKATLTVRSTDETCPSLSDFEITTLPSVQSDLAWQTIDRNCLRQGYFLQVETSSKSYAFLNDGSELSGKHRPRLRPRLSTEFSEMSGSRVRLEYHIDLLAVPGSQLKRDAEQCSIDKERLESRFDVCQTTGARQKAQLEQAERAATRASEKTAALTTSLKDLEFKLNVPQDLNLKKLGSLLRGMIYHMNLTPEEMREYFSVPPRQILSKVRWHRSDWRIFNERLLRLWRLVDERCELLSLVAESDHRKPHAYLKFSSRTDEAFVTYVLQLLNHDESMACRVTKISPTTDMTSLQSANPDSIMIAVNHVYVKH